MPKVNLDKLLLLHKNSCINCMNMKVKSIERRGRRRIGASCKYGSRDIWLLDSFGSHGMPQSWFTTAAECRKNGRFNSSLDDEKN